MELPARYTLTMAKRLNSLEPPEVERCLKDLPSPAELDALLIRQRIVLEDIKVKASSRGN